MSMKLKHFYTIALIALLSSVVSAQSTNKVATTPVLKKSYTAKQGDDAYNLFDFYGAVKYYQKALKCPKKNEDTTYLVQKIADSYRQLNDPVNAESWYAKLADKPGTNALNKFYYAEALRANMNYSSAKKYYEQYKAAVPGDQNVDEILAGIDNLKELSKDKGIYRINLLGINTQQSDFGPAFFKDGQILFASNRNGRKNSNVVDNWSSNNFYQIYSASPDSGSTEVTKVKSVNGCKPNGKFHDGPATYFAPTNELIFTRSNYVNATAKTAGDKRTVKLKLYSMLFPLKKNKITSLPFNNNEYSTAHPAISADGNTLYFSSDKLGGQGGTDLYVTTRDASGVWAEPKNLGSQINTRYDEKFPFIGYDGTLYYSSNALEGLGGLDIYKTKQENGQWTKPENLGAPVNSSRDDFTFIMDSASKHGYFASNRPNGIGDDDIYHFTYDESKLDYKVKVRVIDAVTQQPIETATLALDCKNLSADNTLTDEKGERVFTIKGGKTCVVEANKEGYKPNKGDINAKNKNAVVVIPLTPDVIKLVVSVKEKETLEPLRDVAISVKPKAAAMNYATGDNGSFDATIPAGRYALSSPDYQSITAQFSEADADPATGVVKLEFLIPHAELVVNVPLTANCFSSPVTITDLRTGEKSEVAPNTNGEVRLDLKTNNRYLIEHNGRVDSLSTIGLKPGEVVDGPCKFFVGQTWIIHNIYYDLDKSFIRPDAAKELDNLVRVMKENPTLEIELSSHTDCRQTARYNMILSAKRARSAVDYIVKRGIKAKRIIAAGYGETQLVNGCVCEPTNESPCSPPQHQDNRRTEVKVLRY